MKNLGAQYEVKEVDDEIGLLNFAFLSKVSDEETAVVKLIQYAPFLQPDGQPFFFDGKQVYNMGFGDFNLMTGEINDVALTGNRDTYKVLNTVLSTVPLFFEKYPVKGLMVQGSDSYPGFEEECRKNCQKKCLETCRKMNQRINIYCKYVSREFDSLSADYQFFGGNKHDESWFEFDNFVPYNEYRSVIIYRK